MKPIKTFQGTVYSWDCDQMQHMNVKCYVDKFDQATWNFFSYLGLSAGYLRQNKRGMVALEQHIWYKKELYAGDNIFIESNIIELKEKIIRFKHLMFNLENNIICAETELTGLHIDAEKRKSLIFPTFVNKNLKKL